MNNKQPENTKLIDKCDNKLDTVGKWFDRNEDVLLVTAFCLLIWAASIMITSILSP